MDRRILLPIPHVPGLCIETWWTRRNVLSDLCLFPWPDGCLPHVDRLEYERVRIAPAGHIYAVDGTAFAYPHRWGYQTFLGDRTIEELQANA